ncbi:hypothetical protein E8E11_004647 [Didymella keratinophila]|nr:hypothetical protein E8E11_004647 [Didymella keratinophila]
MSAAAIFAQGPNTVEDVLEMEIKIDNITIMAVTAQQVLQSKEQAAKVTNIEIDTSLYFEALEEQEELAEQFSVEAICSHLNTILDAITSHGGGLTTFSWPARRHTSKQFTRPHAFWKALYAHASTLRHLHLDFFCHEVDLLPPLPTGLIFEALRNLRLDTSSAHGDNGTAIDTLLKACPNLSTLHFEWPPYDLDNCQIKNISWGWAFAELKHLHTSGWNFNPAAYTDFLVWHTGLTSFVERVDGPYESEECGPVSIWLPTTALLNLRVLEKEYTDTHNLRNYFESAADRPIDTLILHVRNYEDIKQELLVIAGSLIAQTLRTLEFRGEISCWRRRDREERSEDEVDDEPPEERDQRQEQAKQAAQQRERKRLPTILRVVLPHLTNLETLSIEMDSSNGTYNSETKGFTCPEPMKRRDLYAILDLLPKKKEGKLKVLRLTDSRAAADPRAGRIREWVSQMNYGMVEDEVVQGSLTVLEWCGEKSSIIELW